ncbi:testis-expressed protein 36 [Discoglossus pictus]
MPKGRLSNPPTGRDGTWFPHIGVIEELPTSSTQDLYRQGRIASRADQRLPLICATQRKGEVNNGFPFSTHDNRELLHYFGEYLDVGLGRRKISKEKRQQDSKNFNLYCHDPPAKTPSYLNGFTNYQTDYTLLQGTEQPLYRRYPKHHPESAATKKREHVMWFADHRAASY